MILRHALVALALCSAACGLLRGNDNDADAPDAGRPAVDGGAAGNDAGPKSPPREPVLDVAYDEGAPADPQRALDLYPPASGTGAPVVVWVHGGAWTTGDKRNQLSDKVALFNGEGYLFVSVNYRLSPTPTASPAAGRVMHPVHAQDVARAVAWVKAHAAEYGGDGSRLALLGHSAGAHLVSLVATSPGFGGAHGLGPSAVRCTASLDTEGYDIPAVMADASGTQRALYENAFGTDPATWTAASPITHAKPGAAIGEFLIARRGNVGRRAAANAFRDALTGAGVAVQVVDVSGYDHEGVNDAVGKPGESVLTPALRDFFGNCLP